MGLIVKLINLMTIELTVLLTAALPVIELRGAIPVGMSLGMSPGHAFLVSFIGSILPAPIIIFTVRPIFETLRKARFFRKFVDRMVSKTMLKAGGIQKYGFWGLLIFVAVPLPGTGVWTGSLAAVLLNIRFKTAFTAIFIGNLIAGIAIMLLSHGLIGVLVFV